MKVKRLPSQHHVPTATVPVSPPLPAPEPAAPPQPLFPCAGLAMPAPWACGLLHPQKPGIHHGEAMLRTLARPEVLSGAGAALPLLILIVEKCVREQESGCELLLCESARQLGVSATTMGVWHRQLQSRLSLASCRRHGRVWFELPPVFAAVLAASDPQGLPPPPDNPLPATMAVPGKAVAA